MAGVRLEASEEASGASLAAARVRAGGSFRWVICGLLFLATMINYMDRQIIGILKPELSVKLGWSDTGYANIVTAFQFSYAFGYLFGGRLMERIGIKRGFPLAVFLWSLASAAHGLARTVLGFGVARLGLGLAEGGNFPAAIKAVGEWFPLRERALATGLFNSASNIGAIVCPLITPWLAIRYGWPAAFYAIGALGVIWVVLWALVYDAPETHPSLSASERAYILDGQASDTPAPAVSWLRLLRLRSAWAYIAANVLAGPVWWFYLFWLPDFLHKRFHLDATQSGLRVGLVYTMAIFGSIGGGWLSSRLIGRGWSVNVARKTAMLVCALCVVPVAAAGFLGSSWSVALIIGLAAAAHQGWSANLYTFVSDCAPKRAVSSIVGLGGFASGLASMAVAQVVGVVVAHTGSYMSIFVWASTMYLLSLLVIHLLVPKIGLPSMRETVV